MEVLDHMGTPPILLEMPLRMDDSGSWRVGDSRVLLDTIITAFNMGTPPETIVTQFDAVTLTEVYQVIAYYLANRHAVDDYIAKREAEAQTIRREWEAEHPPLTKDELLNRYEKRTGKKFSL
jgi:uncharacterized protein (DUF433 family)